MPLQKGATIYCNAINILGNPKNIREVPFSLTEEFVAVYRLHPLLPDDFEVRNHETDAVGNTIIIIFRQNCRLVDFSIGLNNGILLVLYHVKPCLHNVQPRNNPCFSSHQITEFPLLCNTSNHGFPLVLHHDETTEYSLFCIRTPSCFVSNKPTESLLIYITSNNAFQLFHIKPRNPLC